MSFKSIILASVAAAALAMPAFAEGIMVQDAYARASSAQSTSGAAFMTILNHGDADDRLIDASTPVAERAELHTHKENAEGVMQMLHVTEGFEVPAQGELLLERGGHHVMLLGLTQPLTQGVTFPLTLTFEKAGEVTLDVTVDLERKAGMGSMDHSGMQHGEAKADTAKH